MAQTDSTKESLHVLSVLVENEFGVLARIASLFAARGFNIESLTVGPILDQTMSRATIVVKGSQTVIEQVKNQLNKLVEVVAVQDLSDSGGFVSRELMLIKVGAKDQSRTEILNIGNLFTAKAIDYTPGSITFELVGVPEKLDNFILFLQPFGILELVRSGTVAINRGKGGLQTDFQSEMREAEVAKK